MGPATPRRGGKRAEDGGYVEPMLVAQVKFGKSESSVLELR